MLKPEASKLPAEQIQTIDQAVLADAAPGLTSDCSTSKFGSTLVVASYDDRCLVCIDDDGSQQVTSYAGVSYRTMPFAITHDSAGHLLMLRDNYNYGWDTSTVARFSASTGDEHTKLAEVICKRVGARSGIVVNGAHVYFTTCQWNIEGHAQHSTDGSQVWRLPVEFTNQDTPELVFDLPTAHPGMCDCRGITFDADGNLYVTCGNANWMDNDPDPNLGAVVKVDLKLAASEVILDGLTKPTDIVQDSAGLAVQCADGKLTLDTDGSIAVDSRVISEVGDIGGIGRVVPK